VKPTTIKALAGIGAVTAVAVAFFVFGCNQGDLWPILGAILLLAGKEAWELQSLINGGG